MKTRVGFVSNSSSTSFVVIGNGSNMSVSKHQIVIDDVYEFGWEHTRTIYVSGRIAFAWMQAQYQGNDTWLNWIKEIVKEVTGHELICKIDVNNSYESYIDHQSIGMSNEIFESKDSLKRFMFDNDSYVEMGNDNE